MKRRLSLSRSGGVTVVLLLLMLTWSGSLAGAHAATASVTSSQFAPSGCGPGQRETPNPVLDLTLQTDQPTYPVGAPVTFTLTVTNPSTMPITVGLGAMITDFTVHAAATGDEVWRSTHGRVFPLILVLCTFAPGQTMTFTQQWDQRTNEGQPVPPGDYTATGKLASPQPPLQAPPVSFTIGTAQPGRGEQVLLSPGCNNIASTWTNGTPVATIAASVTPPRAVVSVWRYDAAEGRLLGFAPQAAQASDLTTVNRLDAVFVCVGEAASLVRPAI